jgi:UDP-N-acetyl-D-glucosamine dehydrogenase
MLKSSDLEKKILSKKAKIAVVGLGYVGLPLAVAFAEEGYFVFGLDKKPSRIKKLKNKVRYIVDIDPGQVVRLIRRKKLFPTTDEKILKKADVILVCVPTPLRKVKVPDISYVVAAAQTIKKYLRPWQLIILESTSYPGTTREVVLPILVKSGLKPEKDFFLGFSPERVNPGDKRFPLVKIPKVVGGLSKYSTHLGKVLYSKIIKKVYGLSSPEVAETSKLLENTFRLVNIGLVNEFALLAHRLGIDIWEVIKGAKTKPFGFMPFYPGPGTGGHCIPTDPIYLSWKAKKLGFKTRMIDLASFINHFMPHHIVSRVLRLLRQNRISSRKAKILVVGVTYKKDVKDLRESPALEIIEILKKKRVKGDFYDPLIPYLRIRNIDLEIVDISRQNLIEYDCLIIVTGHSTIDYQSLRKNAKLIFDTRNIYQRDYPNVRRL